MSLFNNGVPSGQTVKTAEENATSGLNLVKIEDPVSHPIVATEQAQSASNASAIAILRSNTFSDDYVDNVGNAQRERISQVSTQVLSRVTAASMGDEFSNKLCQVITLTKQVNADDLVEKTGFFSKIRGLVGASKEKILNEVNSLQKQIDRLADEIRVHQAQKRQDIIFLDKLDEANKNEYDRLVQEIEQAKVRMAQRKAELDSLNVQALTGMDVQTYRKEVAKVQRMEHRIFELTAALRSSELVAVQIMQSNENARKLNDKFKTLIDVGIPAWHQQFSLAVMNMSNKKSLAAGQAVEDMTNEIMKKNAAQLADISIETAKFSSGTTIKAETLQEVSSNLVRMLEEVDNIERDASSKNQAAAVQMREANERVLEAMRRTGKTV